MFCKHCGADIGEENVSFCKHCGKSLTVDNQNMHWVPIAITAFSFVVLFGILGGDYYLQEVNIFDWMALIGGVVAAVLSFAIIPKERMTLRVVSIILGVMMALAALSWIFI